MCICRNGTRQLSDDTKHNRQTVRLLRRWANISISSLDSWGLRLMLLTRALFKSSCLYRVYTVFLLCFYCVYAVFVSCWLVVHPAKLINFILVSWHFVSHDLRSVVFLGSGFVCLVGLSYQLGRLLVVVSWLATFSKYWPNTSRSGCSLYLKRLARCTRQSQQWGCRPFGLFWWTNSQLINSFIYTIVGSIQTQHNTTITAMCTCLWRAASCCFRNCANNYTLTFNLCKTHTHTHTKYNCQTDTARTSKYPSIGISELATIRLGGDCVPLAISPVPMALICVLFARDEVASVCVCRESLECLVRPQPRTDKWVRPSNVLFSLPIMAKH